MGRVFLYSLTIFISAFLLFQVQPLIGKCILPWFGSTPGVWTTCMLFFQLLLLGGYAYAHLLVSLLSPTRQAVVHAVLLGFAAVLLPITPSEALVPEDGSAPVGGILLVLAASVGVPYLVLSATGPLLQGWFARLHPGRSPYWLYALSNVGSLLALVTYPVWVERAWGLEAQTLIWSAGFGAFALLAAGCAWTLHRGRAAPASAALEGTGTSAGIGRAALWFALSAVGSALLLATTNQMCLDIAVVPFLWVVPLALYLLSFIFTFSHERLYVRAVFLALLPLALWYAYALLTEGVDAEIDEQIIGYSVALFIACVCCHGELARAKPHPRQLTLYFLIVSAGGAFGGLLVALVAHNVFPDFYEFPILLATTYAVVLMSVFRDLGVAPAEPRSTLSGALRVIRIALVLFVILYVTARVLDIDTWLGEKPKPKDLADAKDWFGDMRFWLLLPVVAVPLLSEQRRQLLKVRFQTWWTRWATHGVIAAGIVSCFGLVAMVAAAGWVMRAPQARQIAAARNFYGTLALKEYQAGKEMHDWTLRHGRIMHGFQYKTYPGWPTSYYGPDSGVGRAIRHHPERWTEGRPFSIGVVGLGTGTLAAYANARVKPVHRWSQRDHYAEERRRYPGDIVRYYEINPLVDAWADTYFTYLSDARKRGADVAVYLGDARLVMERQVARGELQGFDVLAVDAFSSDAIPIHLLTRESFAIYWQHLKPDGALAIHVTNRFIDLEPVVVALAEHAGKPVVYIENRDDDDFGTSSSDWIVVTSNEALLADLRKFQKALPGAGPLWTDDYSSVWDLLKRKQEDDDDAPAEPSAGWLHSAWSRASAWGGQVRKRLRLDEPIFASLRGPEPEEADDSDD
ncbi:MAG: hypothetical protein O2894_08785 [Planctomycetota bacterium]|nr:hypothetical protein [Planctomycetota bacterium]